MEKKRRCSEQILPRPSAVAHSGAPPSMKMGTTRSPWRYDAAAYHALQSASLRRPAILRHTSWPPDFPISQASPASLDSATPINPGLTRCANSGHRLGSRTQRPPNQGLQAA
jgi:hypothetical protein